MRKVYRIETFDDLLRALRERPDWREELRKLVLTDQLLELPKKFDDFVEGEFKPLKRRFDDFIEDEFKPLKKRFDNFVENEFKPLKKRFDDFVENEFKPLKKRFDDFVENEFKPLKKDVDTLKKDVDTLKKDVSMLKEKTDSLERELKILKDDVAYLKGSDFERTVRERAPAYLGRIIRRCRVMSFEELAEKLEDAVDSGVINEDEKYDALLSDLIAKGKINGKEVFVVSEVSVVAEINDVERARKRADIIKKVFGAEVLAVVISRESLPEKVRRRAEELGVVLI